MATIQIVARAAFAIATLAMLALSPAALAGTKIVGYHLTLQINYPPDATNPSSTPTLGNVFIVVEADKTGVGEELYTAGWGSDYAGLFGPLPISPSATTQNYIPFRDGQSFKGATPDHVILFADYADANGVDHVVVGMNAAAAGLSTGESFADVFASSGMTESTLASWLDEEGTLSHNPNGCNSINCAEHESDLAQFAYTGFLQLGAQSPYYDGRAALPGPFDLVSFSDGAIIGAVTADLTPILGASPTPEPSTWAMLLIGFLSLGFLGYRRARPLALAA